MPTTKCKYDFVNWQCFDEYLNVKNSCYLQHTSYWITFNVMDKHVFELSTRTNIPNNTYILVLRPSLQIYSLTRGVFRTLSNIQDGVFAGIASLVEHLQYEQYVDDLVYM